MLRLRSTPLSMTKPQICVTSVKYLNNLQSSVRNGYNPSPDALFLSYNSNFKHHRVTLYINRIAFRLIFAL